MARAPSRAVCVCLRDSELNIQNAFCLLEDSKPSWDQFGDIQIQLFRGNRHHVSISTEDTVRDCINICRDMNARTQYILNVAGLREHLVEAALKREGASPRIGPICFRRQRTLRIRQNSHDATRSDEGLMRNVCREDDWVIRSATLQLAPHQLGEKSPSEVEATFKLPPRRTCPVAAIRMKDRYGGENVVWAASRAHAGRFAGAIAARCPLRFLSILDGALIQVDRGHHRAQIRRERSQAVLCRPASDFSRRTRGEVCARQRMVPRSLGGV